MLDEPKRQSDFSGGWLLKFMHKQLFINILLTENTVELFKTISLASAAWFFHLLLQDPDLWKGDYI